jgi:hypothetical protein
MSGDGLPVFFLVLVPHGASSAMNRRGPALTDRLDTIRSDSVHDRGRPAVQIDRPSSRTKPVEVVVPMMSAGARWVALPGSAFHLSTRSSAMARRYSPITTFAPGAIAARSAPTSRADEARWPPARERPPINGRSRRASFRSAHTLHQGKRREIWSLLRSFLARSRPAPHDITRVPWRRSRGVPSSRTGATAQIAKKNATTLEGLCADSSH